MAGGYEHLSKFNPEARQRLLAAITAGNFYSTACKYAGITEYTLRQWKTRGTLAKEKPVNELTNDDLDFIAFVEALDEAESRAEMVAVMRWREQMPTDWKAAKDFLARRHPERWGAKVEINMGHIDEEILALIAEETDEGDLKDSDGRDDSDIVDAEIIELEPPRELPSGEQN